MAGKYYSLRTEVLIGCLSLYPGLSSHNRRGWMSLGPTAPGREPTDGFGGLVRRCGRSWQYGRTAVLDPKRGFNRLDPDDCGAPAATLGAARSSARRGCEATEYCILSEAGCDFFNLAKRGTQIIRDYGRLCRSDSAIEKAQQRGCCRGIVNA
jgi:hypothetical protein